jgi:hypothetical protein
VVILTIHIRPSLSLSALGQPLWIAAHASIGVIHLAMMFVEGAVLMLDRIFLLCIKLFLLEN